MSKPEKYDVRWACGKKRIVIADSRQAITVASGYECGHALSTTGKAPVDHAIILVRSADELPWLTHRPEVTP